MIFRSRRRRNESDTVTDEVTEEAPDQEVSEAEPEAEVAPESDTVLPELKVSADSADPATLAELDRQEWRDLGPYDLDEVDVDALDAEIEDNSRIDLGSIVLSAIDGMELRLQLDEASQQIVSAMMIRGDSALEVGAFAAPRSGGLWAEIREELVQAAHEAGGSADLVPGPFGTELRRLLPVRAPDGQQGYQPSRMWVAEGPRWMMRGIVYGQAALEDGIESPVAEILEAFRQIVVRRGDEAMAPGDLLPLSLPEHMSQAAPAAAGPGEA